MDNHRTGNDLETAYELEPKARRSRAEVLYCLDVLVRHINDEETAMDTWLALGVPDGTLEEWPTDAQVEPFLALAKDEMSFGDLVRTGLSLLRRCALRSTTEYVERSLT